MRKLACGIDEVGRGALAGPLVVASVVFKDYKKIPYNIKDSKQTTHKQRKCLFKKIINNAYIGTGCIDANLIDKLGISKATEVAIKQSIVNNVCRKDFIFIDGNIKLNLKYDFRNIIKGDCNYVSIAAASIVAKFIRDIIMDVKNLKYPAYCWNKNKGYGTKEHLLAIKMYGITSFHRKSYSIETK
ncbi:MAG: ribonuclease HII [Pseudomonadota bacterium]|nr:ribonuclease HII [Pseudomonadota bacterium]